MIDGDPIAAAVRALVVERIEWAGTASDLLATLSEIARERVAKSKTWPSTPRAPSGRLRRSATFLRKVGVELILERTGRARSRTIELRTTNPALLDPEEGRFSTSVSSAQSAESPHGAVWSLTGASINVRSAPANRDENEFECPAEMDLDRDKPARHMTFGSGIHHCLGAPLARRELWWGFKAFFERIEEVHLIPGANDLRHQPNIALCILEELHIGFTKDRVSP